MDKYQRQECLEIEYVTLCKKYADGISLSTLLTLSQTTSGFAPHHMANAVEGRVAEFAQRHGIWLADRGEHYNTMTAYLHPTTFDEERLYLLGAYYAVLFFIDDVMGNEFRPEMTSEEKRQADFEMDALLKFIQTGVKPNESTKLLPPIIEVLEGFHKLGDAEWVQYFLKFTKRHLELAVQDLDSHALGEVLSADKYVEIRNHVSGMYPAILMMEFAENNYLPRKALKETGLQIDITQLEYLCAAIGGLVNDFFSFEKEVIDSKSDFNLISILMMNEDVNLEDAINLAANFTNKLCEEYDLLATKIRQQVATYPWAITVNRYIDAMDLCNQAVWVWQIETQRYLRNTSIFSELIAHSPNYKQVERMKWLKK